MFHSGTAWLYLLSRMYKTHLRCDSVARLTVYEFKGPTCGRMRCHPWPEGQDVGLLIRRLRVRVPQRCVFAKMEDGGTGEGLEKEVVKK